MESWTTRAATVVLAATAAACGSVGGPDEVPSRTPPAPVAVAPVEGAGGPLALAVSPAGRAVAIWVDRQRVLTSESDDGFAWRPPRPLVAEPRASYSDDLHVELDEDGNGFAAWSEVAPGGDGRFRRIVMTCRYEAVAGWSVPRAITDEEAGGSPYLDLAVTRGRALLAWTSNESVQAVQWDGSGWSSPVQLEAPGQKFWRGVAVELRGGSGIAVWTHFNYDRPPQLSVVRARTWNPEEGWSRAVDLAERPLTTTFLHRPAVDSTGAATVLFGLREHGDLLSTVRAIRHEPGRGWQAPVELGRFDSIEGLEAHDGDALTALLPGDDRAPVSAFRYVPAGGWRPLLGPPLGSGRATLAPGTEQALLSTRNGLWIAQPGDTWRMERVPEQPGDSSCGADTWIAERARIGVDASGARTALWLRFDCRGGRIFAWRAPAE